MQTVILATLNAHKLEEIRSILQGMPIELRSLTDYPAIGEIAETGVTFAENALIKARAVYAHTGVLTLSDDSGLEVDALNGRPGVYSARYAGPGKSTVANNALLLRELTDVARAGRGAQFRCVVAIAGPSYEKTVEGVVRGRIAISLQGTGGFGYDPLFVPEGYTQTFAKLGAVKKNRISHRGRAFRAARRLLESLID